MRLVDLRRLESVIADIRAALGIGARPMLSELPGLVRALKRDYDDLREHHARVEHELVALRRKIDG